MRVCHNTSQIFCPRSLFPDGPRKGPQYIVSFLTDRVAVWGEHYANAKNGSIYVGVRNTDECGHAESCGHQCRSRSSGRFSNAVHRRAGPDGA